MVHGIVTEFRMLSALSYTFFVFHLCMCVKESANIKGNETSKVSEIVAKY